MDKMDGYMEGLTKEERIFFNTFSWFLDPIFGVFYSFLEFFSLYLGRMEEKGREGQGGGGGWLGVLARKRL